MACNGDVAGRELEAASGIYFSDVLFSPSYLTVMVKNGASVPSVELAECRRTSSVCVEAAAPIRVSRITCESTTFLLRCRKNSESAGDLRASLL